MWSPKIEGNVRTDNNVKVDDVDGNVKFEKYISDANKNELIQQIPSEGGFFKDLYRLFHNLLNFKFKTESKASVTVKQLDRADEEISKKRDTLHRNVAEYHEMREQVLATEANLSDLSRSFRRLGNQINDARNELKALKRGKEKESKESIEQLESNLKSMIEKANNFLELYKSKDFSKKNIDKRIKTLFYQQISKEVEGLKDKGQLPQELANVKSIGDRFNPDFFSRIQSLQTHVKDAIEKEKQARFETALDHLGIDNPELIIDRSLVEPILQEAMEKPAATREEFIDRKIETSPEVIKKVKDHYFTEEAREKIKKEIQAKVSPKNKLNERIQELLEDRFASALWDLNTSHTSLKDLRKDIDRLNNLPNLYETMRNHVHAEFKSKLRLFENHLRQLGDRQDPKELSRTLVYGENTKVNDEVLSRYLTDLQTLPVDQWEEILNPKEPTVAAPEEEKFAEQPNNSGEDEANLIRQVLDELESGSFKSFGSSESLLSKERYALYIRLSAVVFQATDFLDGSSGLVELKEYVENKGNQISEKLEQRIKELTPEQEESVKEEISEFEQGNWKRDAVREFFHEKIKECQQAVEETSPDSSREKLDELEKSLEDNSLESSVLSKRLAIINHLIDLRKKVKTLSLEGEDLEKQSLEKFKENFVNIYTESWNTATRFAQTEIRKAVSNLIDGTWLHTDPVVLKRIEDVVPSGRTPLDPEVLEEIENAKSSEELLSLKKELDNKLSKIPQDADDIEKEVANIENFIKSHYLASFTNEWKKFPAEALKKLDARNELLDPKPDAAKYEAFRRSLSANLQSLTLRKAVAFKPASTNLKKNIAARQDFLNSLQNEVEATAAETYSNWIRRNKIAA